jgi:hypothetical protein
MPSPKQPLSDEEKALRKQQRLEKEAEEKALAEAVMVKEMDAYFQGLPRLILNLLSELDKEVIDYTLKQPESNKFELTIHNSNFGLSDNSLNFTVSQDDYSYSDYVNLEYDIDNAFSVIESIRRSRLEEEEKHRKRQAALAKLDLEDRKLLGLY